MVLDSVNNIMYERGDFLTSFSSSLPALKFEHLFALNRKRSTVTIETFLSSMLFFFSSFFFNFSELSLCAKKEIRVYGRWINAVNYALSAWPVDFAKRPGANVHSVLTMSVPPTVSVPHINTPSPYQQRRQTNQPIESRNKNSSI